jgi:MerR family transcriptional regulator, light-induced transcriptional regulator
MGQYSIKELEKLSGIKAHTIRIWEKRHKLIEPGRTATNIRLYSDADLKKIINVAIANNAGFKISRIARLTDDALARLVSEQSDTGGEMAAPIDQLIVAMVELDEIAFERILGKFTETMGFEELVIKVIYPFMEKIGILWQTGNITPAQEHFISNLVRQKLIVAIDGLDHPSAGAPRAVLFLPENEWHEIGLLFYQYLVRKAGVKTIYLGQSVPYQDLMQVVATYNPRWIITTIVTTLNQPKHEEYLTRLSTDFSGQTILISGRALQDINLENFRNIERFSSAEALKATLSNFY